MSQLFPGKIYVSVDAYRTAIKINGWTEDAALDLFDYVAQIETFPLGGVIYTDISKDGKLAGRTLKSPLNFHKRHRYLSSHQEAFVIDKILKDLKLQVLLLQLSVKLQIKAHFGRD